MGENQEFVTSILIGLGCQGMVPGEFSERSFSAESLSLFLKFAVIMALFPNELPKFNRYSFSVTGNCEGKLLEHQNVALEQVQNWFERAYGPIAVVSMPTGSGKSGVICCLPYFLGRSGLPTPPTGYFPSGTPRHRFEKPVLVLTPNLDITKQLERKILIKEDKKDTFLFRRGIVPEENLMQALPQGVMIEGTQQLTQPDFLRYKEVVISNVQKFLSEKQLTNEARWWVEALPSNLFSLVIVDEAHHFPAPTWKRIIDKFKPYALVVFLTATPYKTSTGDRQQQPGQWLHDTLNSRNLTYHLPLQDARNKHIIRNTRFRTISGESSIPEDPDRVFWQVLQEVKMMQDNKNRDLPLPGKVPHMAMAITRNITEADKAVKLWNTRFGDNTAIAFHSKVGDKQLIKLMAQIKEDKVQLVVVVSKLMEGFDHPPISIAAILTGIKSPRKFVQFVGRAQRVVRFGGGQEHADIHADIVTHSCYNQSENYDNFQNEVFVKP